MDENTDAYTRTGRFMLAIGFAFALGLLTLFFQDKLDDQRNPNQDPSSYLNSDGSTEVVLKRNPQGHYVANGSINGHEVEFLLDTGASDVALSEKLARRIGLPFGREGLGSTANGVTTIWYTVIDELVLGSITLHQVPGSILPNMNNRQILLGMSALRQVEFSQQGNQLTLRYHPQSSNR